MFNPSAARGTQRGAVGRRGSGKGETVSESDNLSFSEDTAAKTGKNRQSDNLSFSQDTAAKTGKSKRTVERDAAVGAKLDDKAVAKLQGHPLADNKTELAKLAAMPAKEQREKVGPIPPVDR